MSPKTPHRTRPRTMLAGSMPSLPPSCNCTATCVACHAARVWGDTLCWEGHLLQREFGVLRTSSCSGGATCYECLGSPSTLVFVHTSIASASPSLNLHPQFAETLVEQGVLHQKGFWRLVSATRPSQHARRHPIRWSVTPPLMHNSSSNSLGERHDLWLGLAESRQIEHTTESRTRAQVLLQIQDATCSAGSKIQANLSQRVSEKCDADADTGSHAKIARARLAKSI